MLTKTDKLCNILPAIAIHLTKLYIWRPCANKHSFVQCSIGNFSWRPKPILFLLAT